VLLSGFPPSDPAALEAAHRNLSLADLVVLPGNRGKWWTLPRDAKGFTLRDYNRRMKLLQYLSVDAFSTAAPNGNEITPPPSDPDAALRAAPSREASSSRSRGRSGARLPWHDTVHPKWDGAIQVGYGGRYAHLAFANWNSPVYRGYVKQAMAEVAAAGFEGCSSTSGRWAISPTRTAIRTVMPPDASGSSPPASGTG
jgi:hypothetical protein